MTEKRYDFTMDPAMEDLILPFLPKNSSIGVFAKICMFGATADMITDLKNQKQFYEAIGRMQVRQKFAETLKFIQKEKLKLELDTLIKSIYGKGIK